MLFCHSITLGDGHDETKEFNVTLDPKKTSSVESLISILGTPTNVFRAKVTLQN